MISIRCWLFSFSTWRHNLLWCLKARPKIWTGSRPVVILVCGVIWGRSWDWLGTCVWIVTNYPAQLSCSASTCSQYPSSWAYHPASESTPPAHPHSASYTSSHRTLHSQHHPKSPPPHLPSASIASNTYSLSLSNTSSELLLFFTYSRCGCSSVTLAVGAISGWGRGASSWWRTRLRRLVIGWRWWGRRCLGVVLVVVVGEGVFLLGRWFGALVGLVFLIILHLLSYWSLSNTQSPRNYSY